MESLNEPLLSYWRSVGDWGFKLVILGVAGEVFAAIVEKFFVKSFEKHKSRWKLFEIIAGATLVVGLGLEYMGHKKETLFLDSANARLYDEARQTGRKAAEANERSEQLVQSNLLLRVTVVELERQMAQTKTAVTNLDPIKQPIRSITAQVFLEIRGTNFLEWFFSIPESEQKRAASLSIFGKEGALAVLRCNDFQSTLVHIDGKNDPGERQFSMSFSWPTVDWISTTSGFEYWVARSNVSTSALDKEMVGVSVIWPGIMKGSEIVSGSCLVTINASIQKRFSIPKYTDDSRIDCSPTKADYP